MQWTVGHADKCRDAAAAWQVLADSVGETHAALRSVEDWRAAGTWRGPAADEAWKTWNQFVGQVPGVQEQLEATAKALRDVAEHIEADVRRAKVAVGVGAGAVVVGAVFAIFTAGASELLAAAEVTAAVAEVDGIFASLGTRVAAGWALRTSLWTAEVGGRVLTRAALNVGISFAAPALIIGGQDAYTGDPVTGKQIGQGLIYAGFGAGFGGAAGAASQLGGGGIGAAIGAGVAIGAVGGGATGLVESKIVEGEANWAKAGVFAGFGVLTGLLAPGLGIVAGKGGSAVKGVFARTPVGSGVMEIEMVPLPGGGGAPDVRITVDPDGSGPLPARPSGHWRIGPDGVETRSPNAAGGITQLNQAGAESPVGGINSDHVPGVPGPNAQQATEGVRQDGATLIVDAADGEGSSSITGSASGEGSTLIQAGTAAEGGRQTNLGPSGVGARHSVGSPTGKNSQQLNGPVFGKGGIQDIGGPAGPGSKQINRGALADGARQTYGSASGDGSYQLISKATGNGVTVDADGPSGIGARQDSEGLAGNGGRRRIGAATGPGSQQYIGGDTGRGNFSEAEGPTGAGAKSHVGGVGGFNNVQVVKGGSGGSTQLVDGPQGVGNVQIVQPPTNGATQTVGPPAAGNTQIVILAEDGATQVITPAGPGDGTQILMSKDAFGAASGGQDSGVPIRTGSPQSPASVLADNQMIVNRGGQSEIVPASEPASRADADVASSVLGSDAVGEGPTYGSIVAAAAGDALAGAGAGTGLIFTGPELPKTGENTLPPPQDVAGSLRGGPGNHLDRDSRAG